MLLYSLVIVPLQTPQGYPALVPTFAHTLTSLILSPCPLSLNHCSGRLSTPVCHLCHLCELNVTCVTPGPWGHLQPRGVQWLPADGAAGLGGDTATRCPHGPGRGGGPGAEPLGSLRVAIRDRAGGARPGADAAGHGGGWFQFRPPSLLTRSVQSGLAALRYVDDCGVPTECYPMNPNGSSRGVTALVTCGQHLVAMPHPKWSVRAWQCPWAGRSAATAGRSKAGHRPWLRMFQNAMEWCLQWSEGEKRPLSDQ
ncbi:uncharacterized protein LOC117011481 isoform X2 [Catharus ustulatus]|uniref:uncharacterized protein LOC117011481 isoform X2 n=1 Tax=Catharus ustulatus TaxID=91951 RepID=UPI001409F279|nr:uncharacterized protein LOC117011481 isoform X2 [Catharus ustulatus]